MKSSLRKLRGFAVHRHERKEMREPHQPPASQDELLQASEDILDMRNCYDSLLSAAAATANSAYEFSEALREMGTCLLERIALNDDEESGRVLLMLGKAQFELQKLVDSYRVHVIQTITTPSESLLKELQTVEEMKRQCDEKREIYNLMLSAHRDKGRPKHAKGENASAEQLRQAQEDYQEETTLFVFRLKSLKQGQFRSLLTQAARHHAAQLNFFRKGVKSLEMVEPLVKSAAEQQHIDYQFSGLEDDDDVEDDNDDDSDGSDGELSFDYGQKYQVPEAGFGSRNSMELDHADQTNAPTRTSENSQEFHDGSQADFLSFTRESQSGSQSAPLYPDKKLEASERAKDMHPLSTKKPHTYVLPTPGDILSSSLSESSNPVSSSQQERKTMRSAQLWHSSPLQPNMNAKDVREHELPSPMALPEAQSVLKESNINSGQMRTPPPLREESALLKHSTKSASDYKKIKRESFSGPLTTRASTKATPQPSPPPMAAPKINELHELPLPPVTSSGPARPSLIAHSAPLVPRGFEHSRASKTPSNALQTASPLPTPPGAMARSFSIPSRGPRTPSAIDSKLMEVTQSKSSSTSITSPPLTPLSLTTNWPSPIDYESAARSTKTEGQLNLLE